MILLSTVATIVKKELLSFFDSPSTYIAAIVFLLIWEFLFFRSVFLVGESSLRQLYDYLPWLALFFSAALTMGSFANEKTEGTLEILLTHPVKEIEVVVAKFLAAVFYQSGVMLFVIPIAVSFSLFGHLDWGVVVTQILSGIFLFACFSALGQLLSAILPGQIAALLATMGISFFIVILGSEMVTANIPLLFVPIFEQVSLLTHTEAMARGVIDLRDIWYFLSFIGVCLSLTTLELYKRKYGNRRDYFRSFQIGTYLFVGIAVLTAVIGARIPGRIDVTAGKDFTVSDATKQSLGKLSDIVTITLYASGKLPTQFIPVVREVKDMLRDYNRLGKGNIVISIKDPSANTQDAEDAVKRGIREVQFNVIGQEELQLKTGFLGIVISYHDKHEALPFIETTNDLEYKLTSAIAKLTIKDKKTIAFLSGHGEKSADREYGLLKQELEKQFTITQIFVEGSETEVATDSAALVIAGPTASLSKTTQKALISYLEKGKGILYLQDGQQINQQMLTASQTTVTDSDFLSTIGITIEKNIVYDVRSNETVRMGQGVVGFLLPYPYWTRTFAGKQTIAGFTSDGVVLPWASSLLLDEANLKRNNFESGFLLVTSPYAGVQSENIQISPDKANFSKENLKQYPVAAIFSGAIPNSNRQKRLIVIGDSDLFVDQFIQNAPGNASFGLASLSWLSQQETLASLRIRQSIPQKLLFSSSTEPTVIRFVNMALVVIIPVVIAIIRILRRKKLQSRSYQGIHSYEN